MDASSGNDDNGSNGPDSVHFGWNNDMVDEETYEAQENSENKIQDTNEEAENEENKADENAVNENEADGIGDNEADGADEYVGSYETDSDGDFVSRKTTKVQNHADQPPPMPTSIEPSSPSHSIGPSAPQPSNTPYSPPHSTRPAATPMVFMPTPSVQQSFAFDSTSPPAQLLVIKKTVFSPKRKVTANRSAATVSVPKEAIPSQLTI
ncbi:hypothetical protein V6N11_000410 [Hibiscus sabdariffa]|uniref:Uncharacterized protein n=1 Tax=Hibiscus sabdariffa TaxID=183260 RepID=A0ABR2NSW7_9ROSI